MSKEIDHGVIETEQVADTSTDPVGTARRAEKPATPYRITNEFEWIYTGKNLFKCVVAVGNHPGAQALAKNWTDNDGCLGNGVREDADEQAVSMFDAAVAVSGWFAGLQR